MKRNRIRRRYRRSCRLELLEARRVLAVGFDPAPAFVAEPIEPGDLHGLDTLPLLTSNPSAVAKLFLDFGGSSARTWGEFNVNSTPAYDLDGDPESFCDAELEAIQSIWSRVAESFSPFDLDVTTIDPGDREDLQTLAVAVGGDGVWTGGNYAGAAYLGGFHNADPNEAFVFSWNLAHGAPALVAVAIVHQAGHGFGLEHQSVYDAEGLKVQEYVAGDAQRGPVMGASYTSERSLWWSGPSSEGAQVQQDDLSLMTDGRNGWGYRSDDHADELSRGTPLPVTGRWVSVSGTIETVDDRDVFSFSTAAGTVHFSGDVAAEGPTLDLCLEIYTAAGGLVSRADTDRLGETLSATLSAGDYLLVVSSHGSAGDVGQYTVSGTVVPRFVPGDPLTVPISLDPVPNPLIPAPFVPGGSYPLSAVPPLSSYPSAAAKLFLDFDGAPAQAWGSYNAAATPPYDQDADPTSFCDEELASIRSIWERVAEAFSPYNLDVTTVDPGNRNDLQTEAVVFGGDGAWTGGMYAGVAHIGGFYNAAPNVVYVFTKNLANGNPSYAFRTAVHEAGHSFGLNHQSTYDAQGNLIKEYNSGDSQKAPIMGSAYGSVRGVWHNGPTPYGLTDLQDDLVILTDGRNGWGLRPDDVGNTSSTGRPLTVSGYQLSGAGIIEHMADKDFFLFSTTLGGEINVTVSPVPGGPMLDAQLALYRNNQLVAAASTSSLGETITASLPAGSYSLVVASQGVYGDIGQYTISGTLLPPGTLAPPSNLTATAASLSAVNLAWQDNSNGEDGFKIQRSDNGGATWSTLAATVQGTTYQDTGRAPGATYHYRVYAVMSSLSSDYSNVASVTMVPAAPSNLSAEPLSTTVAKLSWQDNSTGEDGFKVQRSDNGGSTWTTVTATPVTGTTYQDGGRVAGAAYQYRVFAVQGSTASAYSNEASVRMVPPAPSQLAATAASTAIVNLVWQDNSTFEDGFKVQQSTNAGATWTTLTSTAIKTTTYQKTGLTAGTTYWYRVFAVAGTATSDYSNTAQVVTLPAAPSSPRASVVSFSELKITWNNVLGETAFRIERSLTGNSNWTLAGTVPADTLLFYSSDLAPATKYYHRVFAVNDSGSSVSSSVVNATTATAPIPAAPGNPAVTVLSPTEIRVTWSDVVGEASYRIERSVTGTSGWAQVGTVGHNVLEFTDTSLAAATPYYYRVLAVNSSGASLASPVVSGITRMSDPALSALSSRSIRITWNDVVGETSYRIERSLTGAGGWTQVGTSPADVLVFDDTGLTQLTTYYYRLIAVTVAGPSPPSGLVSQATPKTPSAVPAAPGNPQLAVLSDSRIRVSWSNVAEESAYRVERSLTGTSGWTLAGSVPADTLTFEDTGLAAQTKYYYRVVAVNELGSSAPSAVVSATTPLPAPLAPSGVAAAAVTSREVRVSWEDVAYESSYRIERSLTGTSGWTQVGSVPADTLAFHDSGLTQSTKYYYRVIAVNATGDSPPTAVVLATTPATPTSIPAVPSSPKATVISSSQIDVSWRDVSNEFTYRVERSLTGTGDWTAAGTVPFNTLKFSDTGRTPSTKYYYRVFAVNELGSSAPSVVVSGTTLAPPPAAPTDLRATSVGRTSVGLAWTDNATNESGFKIERSTNGTTWSQIATTGANVTTYSYTKLSANTTYYFRVRSYSSVGNSDYTNVVMIKTLA